MKKCFFRDKHDEMWKTLHKCFDCHAIIGKSIEEHTEDKIKALSKEQISAYYTALKEWKNVGESMKISWITDHLVSGKLIIDRIKTLRYLDLSSN